MKLKLWTPLVCLAVFMMFAGPAFAQEDESASAADPKLQKMLDGLRHAKPSNAATARKSQRQLKGEAVNPETNTCAYTFTSGSGTTYLQFCVTVNGNIVEFQSPAGVEQIRQGGFSEGYGICDLTAGDVAYYDYADMGDSGNWDAPVLVSKTASMVKISRTTSDGLWVLTQTITNSPGPNPSAKVLMELKNNSATPKEAFLMRYADVDPGKASDTDMEPDGFLESFDSSGSSAWGYVPSYDGSDSGAPSYGMMFQKVGNPVPSSVPYAYNGYVQDTPDGPEPCAPGDEFVAPLANTDGSIVYLWIVENLNKEQAVSVTGKYFSF